MMKFKDEGVDGNVKGVDFLIKKNKIDAVRGLGRIAGPGKVEVKSRRQGADAGNEKHRHRHRLRCRAAAGHRHRREAHRVVDRRVGAAESAGQAARGRRRRDRARARLGVAAARRGGDRGRVPRPHPPRHRSRCGEEFPAHPAEAGHRVQTVVQGHGCRFIGEETEGDRRASIRRRRGGNHRG